MSCTQSCCCIESFLLSNPSVHCYLDVLVLMGTPATSIPLGDGQGAADILRASHSALWAPTAKKARIQSCHSAQRISEAPSKAELLSWQCYLSLVQEAAHPGRMWSGQILGCSPPEFPSQRGPKDQAMYTYMCSQKMSFLIPISNPASVPKSRVGFLCRCLLKTAHKYSKC